MQKKEEEHLIEVVGKKLRAMMPGLRETNNMDISKQPISLE